MVFQPSMEQEAADGFYALVESLLDDVFNFGVLVPRVAKHKEMEDYLTDVEEVGMKSWYIHESYSVTCREFSVAPVVIK